MGVKSQAGNGIHRNSKYLSGEEPLAGEGLVLKGNIDVLDSRGEQVLENLFQQPVGVCRADRLSWTFSSIGVSPMAMLEPLLFSEVAR